MSLYSNLRSYGSYGSYGGYGSYGYSRNPYSFYRPRTNSHRRRSDTILGRLEERRARMRRNRYSIGNRSRRQPRPSSRDRAREAARLEEEERARIAEREREIREEEEKARLEAAELERLKAECLLVEDVDLHVKANAINHHTDLFECTDRDEDPQCVVRRGQEFEMTLTFQRPWSSKDDDMWLVFKIGDEPNEHKGTYRRMKLKEKKTTNYMTKKKKWGTRILRQEGNSLTIGVYMPPTAIIGEWEYSIRTIKVKDGKEETYDCEGPEEIIVLLNPWCKDDQVYMETTGDLKEYVDNEIGVLFRGSYNSISTKPWDHGQFKLGVLDAVLHILRKSNNFDVSANMGDAVHLSRFLSKILNNCDDNGVLVGRWDGNYEGGVGPGSWMGSPEIIDTYLQDEKFEPVKYGQCWVFSALLTTFCRVIGLPCRSVTNFSSAHDTDLTMTIDKYVDENGDDIEWKNHDSVWNFHVWNEVWILRPDLDAKFNSNHKYDGWQVVDATPQELSDSVFQCGPCPVRAVKEGDVHVGYDTKFVFAEVNADRCIWTDDSPPRLTKKSTKSVGQKISTKFPNGGSVGYYNRWTDDDTVRLDLTSTYKYPEGTAEERAVVHRATQKGDLAEYLYENKSGIEVTIAEPDPKTRVGQDVTFRVTVKNTSDQKQNVRLRTSVRPMNYWGGLIGKKRIANKLYEAKDINPSFTETFELTADAEDIVDLCDDSLSMKILAYCKVRGVSYPVLESDEMSIKAPGIKCTGPSGKVGADEAFDVELILKNPLTKRPLTKCQLKIEGSVIVEDKDFEMRKAAYVKDVEDLKPGEVRKVSVKVKPTPKPTRSKEREMNVDLLTAELPDFVGQLHIELQ